MSILSASESSGGNPSRARIWARLRQRGAWGGAVAVWGSVYGGRALRWAPGKTGDVALPQPQIWIHLASSCTAWIALTMVVFYALQMFPVRRRLGLATMSAIIPLAALVMTTIQAFTHAALGRIPFDVAWTAALQYEFLRSVLYVALILAIGDGIRTAALAEESRLAQAEVEAAIARAELAALSGSTRPEFIAHALGRISSIMTEDAERARTLIARLGDLLRSLLRPEADSVRVAQEKAFLRDYLEFERAIAPYDLAYEIDVAPPALQHLIPAFLLHRLAQTLLHDAPAADSDSFFLKISMTVSGEHLLIEMQCPRTGDAFAAGVQQQLAAHGARYSRESGVDRSIHRLEIPKR